MPSTGFDNISGDAIKRLYENAFGATLTAWKDASPRHHVAPDKGIPPILLFHTGRRMAGQQLSKELVEALRKAGTPAETIHAADKDHAGINQCIGQPGDPYTRIIMAFLAEPTQAGKLLSVSKEPQNRSNRSDPGNGR